MKIIFSSNISWSIYNFRLQLLKSLQEDGHQVYTVGLEDDYSEKLVAEGFHFNPININNNSTNPLEDLKLIYSYYKIYSSIKPDIICHNAIKPNIYGTIAAGILNIPVVNNISGLGTLFIKKSFSTNVAKLLYKFSQKKATKVFFQNKYDRDLFLDSKLISKKKCLLIPGSGVNTKRFHPNLRENKEGKFQFLFIGRLLYDKGINEYIEAIRLLKARYSNVTFNVLGPFYEKNDTAISQEKLEEWIEADLITYLGFTDHVEKYMRYADCVVLPSYREGLSKVLIEASSMGLPIVTTNVPGCKDVVIDGETGFLCEVKDSKDLADKMEKLLLLDDKALSEMSAKARRRAVEVYDEKIIIKHYKAAIDSIINA